MTITPAAPIIPVLEQPNSTGMRITIGAFIVVPFLALIAAVPLAWGGFLHLSDILIAALFYTITAGGITIGYHRFFTHGSFKAGRTIKICLAIAGSLALEGSIGQWVADHRKHHAFSDQEQDPHSPWKYGTSVGAVAKGLVWSHMGWLVAKDSTSVEKYAPDIAADKDLRRINALFPLIVTTSMLLPAVIGGLVTWSWMGALSAFFWATLVRIALVHHVTWSINSVCHVWGKHPFKSRDKSGNVAWLAIPSLGESWHNLHHADPTCARHGVLKGEIDLSAMVIRGLEKAHLVTDVRWPRPERLAKKLEDPALASRIRSR